MNYQNESRDYSMIFVVKSHISVFDAMTEIADIIARNENPTNCSLAYQTTFNIVLTSFHKPFKIDGSYILELNMNLLITTRRELHYIKDIAFAYRVINKALQFKTKIQSLPKQINSKIAIYN